jgi:hypothetical protein
MLSAGLSATPLDCDGVPFDMSHIYPSGNIAGGVTRGGEKLFVPSGNKGPKR